MVLATVCQNVSALNPPLPGLELSPVISSNQHPPLPPCWDTREVCARVGLSESAAGGRIQAVDLWAPGPGIHLGGISNKLCSLGPLTAPLWSLPGKRREETRGLPGPLEMSNREIRNIGNSSATPRSLTFLHSTHPHPDPRLRQVCSLGRGPWTAVIHMSTGSRCAF